LKEKCYHLTNKLENFIFQFFNTFFFFFFKTQNCKRKI